MKFIFDMICINKPQERSVKSKTKELWPVTPAKTVVFRVIPKTHVKSQCEEGLAVAFVLSQWIHHLIADVKISGKVY